MAPVLGCATIIILFTAVFELRTTFMSAVGNSRRRGLPPSRTVQLLLDCIVSSVGAISHTTAIEKASRNQFSGRSETSCHRGGRTPIEAAGATTVDDGVEQLLSQADLLLKYLQSSPFSACESFVVQQTHPAVTVAPLSLRHQPRQRATGDNVASCGRWSVVHVSLCLHCIPTNRLRVILALQHF